MTDAPKRIFAWREEQGDVWTGEWCPADEAEFVPRGAWEMVPATDLATALDDLAKARAEVALMREALTAADALSKAAWQHDDAFCIIEDSAQEAARQELEAKLEAYRESRAALTPSQEG